MKSFIHALAGIRKAVKTEKNMRIHISVMIMVFYFARFYGLTSQRYVLLVVFCGLVIALEMVNTAVEYVVDILSPEYHEKAKIAKDIAAGAVMVVAALSVWGGIMLFWDLNVFSTIIEKFKTDILELIVAAAFVIILGLFIIFFKEGKNGEK
ncbi:MAG: diacylglycerol kinase family protein [Eubacterium sp.]|jgi:diacylglycerol kinase|nr:diacylglycerol kinase family protein [Eubacterium sp.]